ncbi:hypothetical protein HMPREF9192_0516 [Streptococcus vestibularis F0396]|uniref:Uncharacterized protein n=1 Tax=Streptococcus vestibularis F0396 TaxID=904306 RepID=E3CNL5_STRVE|nr:hypothetical protein HMPREF9192_0516 [Streptococcus vestibularis F0396]
MLIVRHQLRKLIFLQLKPRQNQPIKSAQWDLNVIGGCLFK